MQLCQEKYFMKEMMDIDSVIFNLILANVIIHIFIVVLAGGSCAMVVCPSENIR
uniref:Uncharacterized protein n=1 Tax=Helianthus annuus TaxID=4232 RepID=A0A251T7Z9_HELAN